MSDPLAPLDDEASERVVPEFFVCRDRARRYTKRVREAHQERKLAYRGDDIGMETLTDHADPGLKDALTWIDKTEADLGEQRIRDRERGYMELPLLVMSAGIASRIVTARALEHARKRKTLEERRARAGVLDLLEDALRRLDAYCLAYDEKRPAGPKTLVELERTLMRVEAHHALAVAPDRDAPKAFDRRPPALQTDADLIEDLFRAVRDVAPAESGPWHVTPADGDRPLTLALGAKVADAQSVEAPPALDRAVRVLNHLHPTAVRCFGVPARAAADVGLLSEPEPARPAQIARVEVVLADEAAGGLDVLLAACAGADAVLRPDAETAVRRLLDAPRGGEGPAPARVIAVMGLFKALDAELERVFLRRAKEPRARVLASQLPREKTRKAPPKKDLLLLLGQQFEGFPAHRVDDVARVVADGKVSRANTSAADSAALLAVVGRSWRYGGRDIRGALGLEPLDDFDIEGLIQDLCDLAALRRKLELGQDLDGEGWTKLERASVGVLGRVGRLD